MTDAEVSAGIKQDPDARETTSEFWKGGKLVEPSGRQRAKRMSDLNPRQIVDNILRALEYVGKCFDEDPTPTDGSFEAARKKLRMHSSVHVYRPTAAQRRKAKR